jgi:hypothetical protein
MGGNLTRQVEEALRARQRRFPLRVDPLGGRRVHVHPAVLAAAIRAGVEECFDGTCERGDHYDRDQAYRAALATLRGG